MKKYLDVRNEFLVGGLGCIVLLKNDVNLASMWIYSQLYVVSNPAETSQTPNFTTSQRKSFTWKIHCFSIYIKETTIYKKKKQKNTDVGKKRSKLRHFLTFCHIFFSCFSDKSDICNKHQKVFFTNLYTQIMVEYYVSCSWLEQKYRTKRKLVSWIIIIDVWLLIKIKSNLRNYPTMFYVCQFLKNTFWCLLQFKDIILERWTRIQR